MNAEHGTDDAGPRGGGAAGDPDRILPLLWRKRRPAEPTGRLPLGRRPRLTLDTVVTAAIALVDAEDLPALSMNRLARALDVGTMTLYSYVPSKQVLVDLMIDEVLEERALPSPGEPRPKAWRDQVGLYVERTRMMYRTHPWLRHLSLIRPPIGPGMLAEQEYVLSTVADIGLTPEQMRDAAEAIEVYVTATATMEIEGIETERATGQTNEAWWTDRMALWEEYFEEERHPTMTAVWNAGGFHDDTVEPNSAGHEFGLRLLLDGIEALVTEGSADDG